MLPPASENCEEVSLLGPPLQEPFLVTQRLPTKSRIGVRSPNLLTEKSRGKARFLRRREVDSKLLCPEVQGLVRTIPLENKKR